MHVPPLGAQYLGDRRCRFTLWAPLKQQVSVYFPETERTEPLTRSDDELGDRGYWQTLLEDIEPGALYRFEIEGDRYPDPASRFQPEGVHGPSAVVDTAWDDQARDWSGLPLADYVIYELHIGTFTPEGTFEAAIARLDELKELGITAIELMPVAQFPGGRNWGYDGTFPFATQNSYGGVAGLQRLVDACHQKGLAVILDVVYNHLGPEGNSLWHLGTYFTERYKTPWGSAVNYDERHSDGVREYVIQNALYWLETCRIDALRLDAIHAIYDFGGLHILKEMRDRVSQISGFPRYLIAESDLNDPRIIDPVERGGYGLDAQWSDDFHHALHTALTGESQGYYSDFGQLSQLARAYENAFVYAWNYSRYRQRMHGFAAPHAQSQQFVVSIQNHDQVGNRGLGDRLGHLVSFEAQKLAAAALLLSPFVPMLFMGEEYGETAPFLYFVSHSDPALIEAVRQGRRREFADFHNDEDGGDIPDPQAVETFEKSRLNWSLKDQGQHQQLWQFYQELLRLRRQHPVLQTLDHRSLEAKARDREQILILRRWCGGQASGQAPGQSPESSPGQELLACFNFSDRPIEFHLSLRPGTWQRLLHSADPAWGGPGQDLPQYIPTERDQTVAQQTLQLLPQSVVVYSTAIL